MDGQVTMVIVGSCVPCRSGGEGLNERQCVMSRETDRIGPLVGCGLYLFTVLLRSIDIAVQPCGSVYACGCVCGGFNMR